jgi:thymidylate synthase
MTHNTVEDIRYYFYNELAAERYTVDKTGAKTIEMLGASFIADEPAIFGTPVQSYIDAELKWYEKGSTNINDIHGASKPPPAAWLYAADPHGNINSNYGHLVDSPKFYNQYYNAIDELIANPDSRRAQMVYNRPSIWVEYNENGKSDFICTNAQTFYIRDNKLHMVSQMRSNDVVFGYKNDYAWAQHLMDRALDNLNEEGYNLAKGDLTWQVMSLHVYERHFDLVSNVYDI